ncbi:hypothetical protein HJC23_001535 [Cyclotella cryptica]|uniref:rRNA-processing protein FYV7 n=1 Tax=Cyclotella cryptica TaxID=29204 RepID=A0ABD3PWJ7_9STRA|eukprot:CCRYP_010754-RA/>CCRYP_010754-RA protein AED:0.42 eAED:0.42 QI:0/-1/0/1/-1/1/1/0/204
MSSHRRRRPPILDDNDDHDNRHPPTSRQSHDLATQKRRAHAISLHSFSTKRGHDRALAEFKKRKETKFLKNAALLREYSKAMKSEGFDIGRGASRKRDRDYALEGKAQTGSNEPDVEASSSRKKRHKSDPLHDARKKAIHLKESQLEKQNENKRRQDLEEKKMQNRKNRARKLMQRTKNGQPLMKNVICDLLGKIKSDVGADEK